MAAVCAGLALSSVYGYLTLSRAREQYLRTSATSVAIDLDRMTRGPGAYGGPGMGGPGGGRGRGNPAVWQEAFEEYIDGTRLAYLALLDESGASLAGAGPASASVTAGPEGFVTIDGREVYVLDSEIGPARTDRTPKGSAFGQRHLRIALYTTEAEFLRTQARLQLVMTAAAIAALIALSYFFLRTLGRFLELQAREESARHLASLGAMAATLAHEIRNPLGAMKGLTQLAQEELPRDHQAQSFMKTVVGEAERLERLVTDLLSFARPQNPGMGRFDFIQLLRRLREELQSRPGFAERTIEIHSPVDTLPIESDQAGLRQILLNIVINALEASPPGRAVYLRVTPGTPAGYLRVEVEDEGPGLGTRPAEELFEPFITTKTQGTGLGLSISRRIAVALGGGLSLENRTGGGARCTLTLPQMMPPPPGF